jgi:hypothetical protein
VEHPADREELIAALDDAAALDFGSLPAPGTGEPEDW